MAKQIALNQLFQGQSGRIGNYVLRIINGQTYISIRPKKRTHSSPRQLQQMSRFQLAIKWANAHKHDPEFVRAAQKDKRNGINSYNLAIKHALNNPSILAEFTTSTTQPEFISTTTKSPTKSPSITVSTTTKSNPAKSPLTTSLKAFLISIITLITTTLTSYALTPNHSPETDYIYHQPLPIYNSQPSHTTTSLTPNPNLKNFLIAHLYGVSPTPTPPPYTPPYYAATTHSQP